MKRTKIINLFGQPSAGKSTTAAGLFHQMKLRGYNCELINEHAKDMVWKDLPPRSFEDQLYITAKQNSKQFHLIGKVDYIITDSPVINGIIYAPETYYKSFAPLVLEIFRSYNNINFLLNRVKKYNPVGRLQTEEEAAIVGNNIKSFLIENKFEFKEVSGDKNAPEEILKEIEK